MLGFSDLTVTSDYLVSKDVLDSIEDKRKTWSDRYLFDGKPVPRVSEILDVCIGKSYLLDWAASLGSDFRHERSRILDTGTFAHALIEDFLKYGYIRTDYTAYLNENNLYPYKDQSMRCYYNFVAWWNNMIDLGFRINILSIEKKIVCPIYGGTVDIIAKITDSNGVSGNYILDIKSSKSISIDYFYQVMLYKKAIEYHNTEIKMDTKSTESTIEINGVGIIRCDKFECKYEYYIVNEIDDLMFMRGLEIAADHMLDWYYSNITAQYHFKQFKKDFCTRYK